MEISVPSLSLLNTILCFSCFHYCLIGRISSEIKKKYRSESDIIIKPRILL